MTLDSGTIKALGTGRPLIRKRRKASWENLPTFFSVKEIRGRRGEEIKRTFRRRLLNLRKSRRNKNGRVFIAGKKHKRKGPARWSIRRNRHQGAKLVFLGGHRADRDGLTVLSINQERRE